MKVKEESEKIGLKLNIQKMKIMASGPITSWEIDGETVETVEKSDQISRSVLSDSATGKQDTVTINCQEETHDFLKCKLLIESHLIAPIG